MLLTESCEFMVIMLGFAYNQAFASCGYLEYMGGEGLKTQESLSAD